jgi:hypothetical protein
VVLGGQDAFAGHSAVVQPVASLMEHRLAGAVRDVLAVLAHSTTRTTEEVIVPSRETAPAAKVVIIERRHTVIVPSRHAIVITSREVIVVEVVVVEEVIVPCRCGVVIIVEDIVDCTGGGVVVTRGAAGVVVVVARGEAHVWDGGTLTRPAATAGARGVRHKREISAYSEQDARCVAIESST